MVLGVVIPVDTSFTPSRNGDPYHLLINRLMVGVDQFDEDLVRPRREAIDDDRIAAGVCPVPHGVIDRHVDVSDPGSHVERGRSKDLHNVQVLGTILNKQHAARERLCDGRIENDLRRWFVWSRSRRR